MKNAVRIASCDLRRILKDKMALLWIIIMPMTFVILFGSMVKQWGNSNNRTWLPVFNHDEGDLSGIFVETLKSDDYYVDIRSATEEEYVKNWPRAVILPATFTADLLQGERANIIFVKGEGDQERAIAAQARVFNTLTRFIGALAAADPVTNKWTERTKERFLEELDREPILQVEKKSHSALRPPPAGMAFTLPAYLVMFTLMNSVMLGGISLARDRVEKQFQRLVASPVSRVEIIVGKILGRMLLPLIQAVMMLFLGNLVFGISLGDHPLVLIPVIVCFAVCCGCIAIFFAVIFWEPKAVEGFGNVGAMVMAALGGCWWPIEIVPDLFKTIAKATPTYWGLRGLQDVMSFGKTFDAVVPECLILLAFATVFAAITIPIMRSKVV